MIIQSILIKEGFNSKEFCFSDGHNLIFSKTNSRGKTTLLRLILYALGYSIPATRFFRFDRCSVELCVVSDSGEEIRIVRSSPDYLVLHQEEKAITVCLPDQFHIVLSSLFKTENNNLLNNLLGVFYLDQEKGWTLLNRGVVIGSIHFNIEDLILGLSERDCSELKSQESRLLDELNKYRQISNVVKYKESIEHSSGSIVTDFLKEEVNTKLEQKIIEREMIRSDLKRIDRVMQSNKQIKSYIEDLRLLVETPSGDLIPVTSENLHGLNDSIEYLVAKRKIKAAEYKSLSREIEALKNENNNNSNTELFKVESISSAFDEMVRQFPYGYEKIERIISEIKEQLSVVRKQISDFTRFNNDVVKSLSESILGYAEFLGVGDRATMSSNYLFTSNLKELSGAILHKMVFSFRLAFIKEVKTRIGVTLPIILDSPSGKEIDKDNIQLMIDLLERDFKEHQVIIASIFHYNITNVREIELHNYLME